MKTLEPGKIRENPWKTLKISLQWSKSMKINENQINQRKSMKNNEINENQWKSMKINEKLLKTSENQFLIDIIRFSRKNKGCRSPHKLYLPQRFPQLSGFPLGSLGGPLGSLVSPLGFLGGPMGSLGFLLGSWGVLMGSHGYPMDSFGFRWMPMGSHGLSNQF